jgi:hypothetical protein
MSQVRIPRLLATSLGAMLFISCTNPQWVCGCSPVVFDPPLVLHGQVTDPSGAPLPGAAVSIEAREGECEGDAWPVVRAQSGADGRYSLTFGVSALREGFCARAHAAPPAGRDLGLSDTIPLAPLFGADTLAGDSARADFRVRAI